jgi:hypothetical protein
MPSLRSIATKYHQAANKIAARTDKRGEGLTANQAAAVQSYRDSAAKVEALIRPEDSEETGKIWNLQDENKVLEKTK